MSLFEGYLQVTVLLPQSIMGLFSHLHLVLTYLATPSTQLQLRAASPAPGFLDLARTDFWGFHLSTKLIVTIPLICEPTPTCLVILLKITPR